MHVGESRFAKKSNHERRSISSRAIMDRLKADFGFLIKAVDV